MIFNPGPRPPTVGEIDRALALWDDRLRQIDENLLALEGQDVVQRLKGLGYYPTLTLEGLTRSRVEPALAALDTIFAQRSAITEMLDQVRELRRGLNSRWPNDRSLHEIGALLFGPSVPRATARTPLDKRGLLTSSSGNERVPAEALLGEMTHAFGEARDAILAVEKAWERLDPTIEAAKHEVETLESMAHALGTAADTELAPVRMRLTTARQRVDCDPLGTEIGLTDSLVPLLRHVRERLAALLETQMAAQTAERRARDGVGDAIIHARDLLRTLTGEQSEAYTRYLHCEAEIAPPSGAVAPPDAARVAELTDWLATLERTAREGHLQAAGVGLERWTASADATLTAVRAARAACDAALNARDGLAGRLAARRQQLLAAMRRGVALDPAIERIAADAETLLRQRPLPLRDAEARVREYEARVRALPR